MAALDLKHGSYKILDKTIYHHDHNEPKSAGEKEV